VRQKQKETQTQKQITMEIKKSDTVRIKLLHSYRYGDWKTKAYLSKQGYTFKAAFLCKRRDRISDHAGTFALNEVEIVNKPNTKRS
jgi:hypothetical protein